MNAVIAARKIPVHFMPHIRASLRSAARFVQSRRCRLDCEKWRNYQIFLEIALDRKAAQYYIQSAEYFHLSRTAEGSGPLTP
jgi:hypothetical protein